MTFKQIFSEGSNCYFFNAGHLEKAILFLNTPCDIFVSGTGICSVGKCHVMQPQERHEAVQNGLFD